MDPLASLSAAAGEEKPAGLRPALVLEGIAAQVVVDLGGGSLGDFHFAGSDLNPLQWNTPIPGDLSLCGFGHFLCLDRWGPPSEAEGARGMPYHGEAAHVAWTVVSGPVQRNGLVEAQLTATLPKAGLSVRRTIRLSLKQAVFLAREEVTNENCLGRIYNLVQHPTIGPPFLDESTVVDCNGGKGFAQGGSLPTPEEPAFSWPQALDRGGKTVDLRRLTDDPNPNVVSYVIEGPYGWVTAATPRPGVLIGYLWKTTDYPWVSLWRDVREGKPAARGLEFGTTGLHQPYSILVQKGRIWNRALFEYLDAGETRTKSYLGFLSHLPGDFKGVDSIEVDQRRLILHARAGSSAPPLTLDATGLLLD